LWVRVIVVLGLYVPAAFAGHPMLSEDTGTQGRGNVEVELGYAWSELDGASSFLFQPQVSYGASPSLDLIIQPSWLIADVPPRGRVRALGDTNLDLKWRFYGAAPWSVGIRAGLEVPTAQDNLGVPHHKVSPHALLVGTADYAPWSLVTNLGAARVPSDGPTPSNLYHFSVATVYTQSERVFLLVDVAADTNPVSGGPSYRPVALVGFIFTVRPGFDIDAGYRAGLNSPGSSRQWLLGFTFRDGL
jgi:hypothetical protein